MFRLRHSAAALVAAGGVGLTGGVVALACTGTLGHSTDASLVLSSSPSTNGLHTAQKVDATETPTATPSPEPTETAEPSESPKATETPEPFTTPKPAETAEPTETPDSDVDEASETAEPDETHEAAPAAAHEQSDKHDDHGADHGGGNH